MPQQAVTCRSNIDAKGPNEAPNATTGSRMARSVIRLLRRRQGPGTASLALAGSDLDSAIETAWNHPHHWVRVQPPDGGVVRVLCSPRTSKQGVNYWLWGYWLQNQGQVWRASRRPLEIK